MNSFVKLVWDSDLLQTEAQKRKRVMQPMKVLPHLSVEAGPTVEGAEVVGDLIIHLVMVCGC